MAQTPKAGALQGARSIAFDHQQGALRRPSSFLGAGMSKLPEPTKPHTIVLGLDTGGKAHASQFGEAAAALAEKAAGMMGMQLIRVTGDDLEAHAADLPRGKVFASGNAFVPFVARPKYDRLIALAEAAGTLTTPERPAEATDIADEGASAAGGVAGVEGEGVEPHRPGTWADIMVGSLVLVSEGDTQGWWEAVVLELAPADALEDDLFTLSFRDFPDYAKQVSRRADLALLPHFPIAD